MKSTSKEYRAYDNLVRRHNLKCSYLFFIATVGPAPSLTHTVKRLDKDTPFHITNIAWFPKPIANKDKRAHAHEIKSDMISTIDIINKRR